MDEWIPFEEGKYRVERAVLIASDDNGMELKDAVLEIWKDPRGRRRMRGRGRGRAANMVSLLDEGDELDLLLDLGEEFKYRLRHPRIQSGKVFASDVESVIQFIPQGPWEPMAAVEFDALLSRVRIIPWKAG